MKAAKTKKKLKEMPYPPQKKGKGNRITPAKTNAQIWQTSSEGLKLIIETYQMRDKELKMKLGQLQEEISKATLPVGADLSKALNQLFWKLTKEKCTPFMKLILEEQHK